MKAFTTLAALLPLAVAIPTSNSKRDSSAASTLDGCINGELRTGPWLVADCLTGDANNTRIKSAVYLPNKVVNDDGILKWQDNGNFQQSCADCKLINGIGTLNCNCRPNYGSPSGVKNATLDLSEHIASYSGHLLSDLKGQPKIPTAPSKYPVPGDLSYGFGGNATCPDSSTYDWCNSVAHTCSNTDRMSKLDTSFVEYAPLNCYIPQVYFPNHFQFSVIKLIGEGAWELAGYDNEQCTGDPVGTIGNEEMGTCKTFTPLVRAISARPLFNGDPN